MEPCQLVSFRTPDDREKDFLKSMDEVPSRKPYVYSAIFAAVIIIGVTVFKAPVYYLSVLFIPLILIVYTAWTVRVKPDCGVLYAKIAAKRSVRHGRNKQLYVAIWSEQSGQFCDRIEFVESETDEFRRINPGDSVIVYKYGKRIFARMYDNLL